MRPRRPPGSFPRRVDLSPTWYNVYVRRINCTMYTYCMCVCVCVYLCTFLKSAYMCVAPLSRDIWSVELNRSRTSAMWVDHRARQCCVRCDVRVQGVRPVMESLNLHAIKKKKNEILKYQQEAYRIGKRLLKIYALRCGRLLCVYVDLGFYVDRVEQHTPCTTCGPFMPKTSYITTIYV